MAVGKREHDLVSPWILGVPRVTGFDFKAEGWKHFDTEHTGKARWPQGERKA